MQARHVIRLIGMSDLWGASFPLLRIASPAFGPMALAGIRCALAALVLAVPVGVAVPATALITGFNPCRVWRSVRRNG